MLYIMVVNNNVSANDLLLQAKKEINKVPSGAVFLVRDLFKGYEWNLYPRNIRLVLGTLFLNYVESENTSVLVLEKTSSNQQKYKKV